MDEPHIARFTRAVEFTGCAASASSKSCLDKGRVPRPQAALSAAAAAPKAVDQIQVAAGNYTPSIKTDPADDRTATFQLINSVAIYGGFPIGGGTWADRAPATHISILSGDIGTPGDDSECPSGKPA